MKSLIYSLFLFLSFYCSAQDSIKVAGYGSMSSLPFQATEKENIAHFEFSHFSKNTTLEVTLWSFQDNIENINKTVIFLESLDIKENPRVDLIIKYNKNNQIEICCNFIGKFFSVHPLKSNTQIAPYIIKSLPKIMDKVAPIILFAPKENNIGQKTLDKITTLQEFDIEKEEAILKELLSQTTSFKILTYQLKEK